MLMILTDFVCVYAYFMKIITAQLESRQHQIFEKTTERCLLMSEYIRQKYD